MIGRGELAFAGQHRQRRISQQRIAGADTVDQAFDKAVDDEERVERLMIAVAAGQHALVAELEDQRLALRRVVESSRQRPDAGILVAQRKPRLALVRRDQVEAVEFR